MMIKNVISRFSKILFGVFLIGLTLTLDASELSGVMLLSLIAVPFIIAGMFNWTPLVWAVEKSIGYIKPLAAYVKPPMKSV